MAIGCDSVKGFNTVCEVDLPGLLFLFKKLCVLCVGPQPGVFTFILWIMF